MTIDVPIYDELDPNYIPVVDGLDVFPSLKAKRKPVPRKIREHLVAMRGEYCEDCKGEFYDEVHHSDRNPWNNESYNLLLLCQKCHQGRHEKNA